MLPIYDGEDPPLDIGNGLLSGPIPAETPDPNDAEALVARSMSASSKTELEQAYYDVHGITDEVVETRALIEDCLATLDTEIQSLNDKQAYLRAEGMNSDYVKNRDFRLMFLRADRFNTKRAALRLIRHFQLKLELFGADKLAVDITQDDLVSFGSLQGLPSFRLIYLGFDLVFNTLHA